METNAKTKKLAAGTLYTIGGALVLNGVLQLLVYPQLAARLGAERNGSVLFVMAFVNILGPSIGQALNNSRLVLRRDMDVRNGDYNLLVLALSAAGILISLIACGSVIKGTGLFAVSDPAVFAGGAFVLAGLLILLTNFRYYGDVEYRLSGDFRSYFFYYAVCGAGYILGYLLYLLTGVWYLIFLAGEAAALVYVYVRGRIFRPFADRSDFFSTVRRRGTLLVLSYLVTNISLNIDRIYLKAALSGEAVTEYYVVSLIGKTLVLFIAPINTVLISYLTKDNVRLTRKRFLLFAGAGAAVSAVFFILCEIGTPIFVRLFYPSLYESVRDLTAVVNLSQILAMYSAYLFIIVLTFTGAHYQLLLQGVHLVVLTALMMLMTGQGGLKGFSTAVLIANALRIAAVITLGMYFAGKDETGRT